MKVGGLGDETSVLVPGDCGRWDGVGLALQSDRLPHTHIDHYGRVAAAVSDAGWNCSVEEKQAGFLYL